jgi:hypothetical protein
MEGEEKCVCALDGRWQKLFTTAADATFKVLCDNNNAIIRIKNSEIIIMHCNDTSYFNTNM